MKNKILDASDINLENTKSLAKKYNHKYIIKLNHNENKYKSSPNIKKNIKLRSPHIYPELNDNKILGLFENRFKIKYENIFFANGSDAILDHLTKIFGFKYENKSNVIVPAITYRRIEITCSVINLNVKKSNLNDNYNINLNSILENIDKHTTMIYLVNPNMPTGLFYNFSEINKFLSKIPSNIIVILDNAYIEFALDGNIEHIFKKELNLINKYSNLIITKTFSKYWALASFRIGYCLSNKKNIEIIKKTYQYLPVSKYSYQAAYYALLDNDYYKKQLITLNKEKEYMYKQFDKLGINYLKSFANFIFLYNLNFNENDLIYFILKKYGVLIRKLKNGGIRITIGTPKENRVLIKGIKNYLNLKKSNRTIT